VQPGTDVTLVAEVAAPVQPGSYILQWDMVEEGISWFRGYGTKTGDTPIRIEPAAGAVPAVVAPLGEPPMPILPSPARIELWRAALRLWAQHPLLGIGPDNFRRSYGKILGLNPYDDRIHANSLYFETLANTGLLGLAALLALTMSLFVTARNGWRRDTTEQRVLGLGLVLATSAFFVHGAVDYFLPFTPTSGLFWILAGATVGVLSSPSKRLRDWKTGNRRPETGDRKQKTCSGSE
jgi:hypothetical protein